MNEKITLTLSTQDFYMVLNALRDVRERTPYFDLRCDIMDLEDELQAQKRR